MKENSKVLFHRTVDDLNKVYNENEAQSITFLLLQHFFNLSKLDVLINQKPVDYEEDNWNSKVALLKSNVPVQYVIGEAWFYDHLFKVNSSVLIPRNETEELVDLVIKHYQQNQDITIIDLGTGSGCIAISLKLNLPQAKVIALDVSKTALEIALHNATTLGVEIDFLCQDMRSNDLNLPMVDVIVSNPPYVTHEEKKLMNPNVLLHEPHLALFVEDDRPLEFYEAIADLGHFCLKKNGRIFLEINEHLGKLTVDMLQMKNYQNIMLLQDIHGKDRMITAELF
jgi:release factor glutamine methyltransferase